MMEVVESLEFQNETQGPSTPDFRAKGARQSSAQDDTVWVKSECLEHGNSEFAAILRVLAESRWPKADSKFLGGHYEL
jgi:hypothetical protein